ncbi:MAG: hypothetical protein Kow00104_00300 [Rhodothalassiaceae bacterium]
MAYFSGLDILSDETEICEVGDDGRVVPETALATDPELIAEALKRCAGRLRRVGHEAGSLSPWLHAGMIALGLPAGAHADREMYPHPPRRRRRAPRSPARAE